MAKKTVAIIGTRGYPSFYGGFETAVRKLVPYLVDAGWEVDVYGRKGTTSESIAETISTVNRRVTWGIESKSLSTLSYGLSASGDAALRRPDVALVMNAANGYFLPLLKARGIPTMVNVDGIEWERQKWGRMARSVFLNGARMSARFASTLVFDARAIEDYWSQKFNVKGEFIPYGGDVPPELPLESPLVSGGYVLVVARFVPENTIPQFLDAAERLSERWPVVVVGSSGYGGPIEERVQKLAQEREGFHWLGHIRDDQRLNSLWQHAGAYFHGHSVGGTNPALVQAMACAAPIVARDTVYNREVLEDSALFVGPDGDDIFARVSEMMQERQTQETLSMRSLSRAVEHYSWDSVCERYLINLEKLRDANPI